MKCISPRGYQNRLGISRFQICHCLNTNYIVHDLSPNKSDSFSCRVRDIRYKLLA
jgi:hypothetical protein